ncbi:MAG TPA: hypothetical protein VHE61_02770 [Opitutaceae bacterium]|nr:hypothetical protein [Opitutaceae bacterium]
MSVIVACPPAQALVSLNDGHDHIYVTGGVGFGWDSNVFASNDAQGDSSTNASILLEYTRRAGWIGVNGSLSVQSGRYGRFTSENFTNPKLDMEFTKQTGRTTGSLTLSAARESRADAAVNVRTSSWNYATGLNFRYPMAGLYTLSGQLGFSDVIYVGGSGQSASQPSSNPGDGSTPTTPPSVRFPDLATYTASFDLIRILSSERDLMLGYRYRKGQTSASLSNEDHSATIGLTGKLIRGLNGSLRVGYQIRIPHGADSLGLQERRSGSWTASGSATYPISKRLNFTGTIGKDFSTTANDISVDTTMASLDFQYAYSSHWVMTGSLSAGDSRFLGDSGRELIAFGPPPILGPSRHDQYLAGNLTLNYSLNEHLKVAATAAWFRNWSNSNFAQFVRKSYNLSVSSRW